jgi:hypothetical protein
VLLRRLALEGEELGARHPWLIGRLNHEAKGSTRAVGRAFTR